MFSFIDHTAYTVFWITQNRDLIICCASHGGPDHAYSPNWPTHQDPASDCTWNFDRITGSLVHTDRHRPGPGLRRRVHEGQGPVSSRQVRRRAEEFQTRERAARQDVRRVL